MYTGVGKTRFSFGGNRGPGLYTFSVFISTCVP